MRSASGAIAHFNPDCAEKGQSAEGNRALALRGAVELMAVRSGQGAAGVIDSASRSAEAARLAKEMMAVVYARGVDPKVEREESTLGRIPGFLAGHVIKAMANRNPAVRPMMSGGGQPRFLALLPLDVLAEARRLGVRCPRLEALEEPLTSLTGKAGARR